MGRKPLKSETLTIRLDPKTRFMLDFIARLRGQPLTTVVERAIAAAADAANIEQRNQFNGELQLETWRDYWDVVEGVRALKLANEPQLHPTYDEERRYAFAKKHWPFFFTNESRAHYRAGYIEILWPRIDEFVAVDDQSVSTDYFAAGKAMLAAISNAGVVPPEWPVKAKDGGFRSKPSVKPPAFEPGGMDDDIPF